MNRRKTSFFLNQKLLFVLVMFLISPAQAAIFGANHIQSLSIHSPDYSLAQATAIAVLNTGYTLSQKKNELNLLTNPLEQLCKDEMFFQQPSVSFSCTGFLVAPDLLVTAGHCVYAVNTPNQEIKNESGLSCEAFDWVFGYEKNEDSTKLPRENLYHCKRIIYAVQKEAAPYPDYALIQLDRPVQGRKPMTIASENPLLGDSVKMIGYPFGTPTKISDHGQVILNNLGMSSLVTNLDAFVGFSGSPVLNAKNEVIGILVGGTPSANTYFDSQNKCERLNRCDEDGKNCLLPDTDMSFFPSFQKIGSDVQRIDPIRDLLQQLQK